MVFRSAASLVLLCLEAPHDSHLVRLSARHGPFIPQRMAFCGEISDIPLKPLVETFVDEPLCFDDVNSKELAFDLKHKIKDINRLHAFHAIQILADTVQTIITLQQDRKAFLDFRTKQLSRYNLHEEDEDELPPLKVKKLNHLYETPDSIPSLDDEEIHIIPIETLVKNTDINKPVIPITTITTERLQKELDFHLRVSPDQTSHLLKSFNLLLVPPISISDFLLRVQKFSPLVSISLYIHTAFMLYKLCVILDVVTLTHHNAYRFLLAGIRCSTKKLEDVYQKQKQFASVGGVSQKDLCKIEIGFLYLCNFKVVIGEAIMNEFLQQAYVELYELHEKNNEAEPSA